MTYQCPSPNTLIPTIVTLSRGIERFSRFHSLHNLLRDYCSSMGVTCVDNFNIFWKQNTFYKEDGIHPNNLGSWILSQHYKAALRQWLINDPSPAHLIPTIVTQSCHNASENVHYTRGIGRHNVSYLMYIHLTALNASADPTTIVCSNHVPMNQIYTVSTEAVCLRKSTVCSSPCTNINNMSISTSSKLPSKAMKTSKHTRRKVLKNSPR